MSRLNPTVKNPATRFMQWKGAAEAFKDKNGKTTYEGGKITWYDKETETDVEVKLPFSFMVLDELHTITGFSESRRSGFWSNEVRDLKNGILTVKAKSGTSQIVVARGTYDEIKDKVKAEGGKYTKSVYIAFKDESGELVMGHLKIAGAALTAWIEFQSKFNVEKCAVLVSDEPKLEKKGTNHYFSPVFEGQNVAATTEKDIQPLLRELGDYLNVYLSKGEDDGNFETVNDDPEDDEEVEIEDTDVKVDLPEEDAAPKEPTDPEGDEKDKKINLADIPF